jgi:hypothetical protein
MQQEYDVPLILRITDSFGQTFTRSQLRQVHDGGITLTYVNNPDHHLRPGDTLSIEVEVDPAYEPESYSIQWSSTKRLDGDCFSPKLVMTILDRHVGQSLDIQCRIAATRSWHRMQMGVDDFLLAHFKVLPPIR